MSKTIPSAPILDQMDIKPVDGVSDTFSSIPSKHYVPTRSISVFGGQLIAHVILAASSTVPVDLFIHSFKAEFIDRTDPGLPIIYKVTRIRTGKNIAVRLTQAFQNDKLVFTANMSFHKFERDPGLRQNRALPTWFPKIEQTMPVKRSDYYQIIFNDGMKENDAILLAALEVKHMMPNRPDLTKWNGFKWGKNNAYASQTIVQYLKVNGQLPQEQKYHAAAFGLASDAFSSQLPGVVLPRTHDIAWATSLDHVIYFHKPFDCTKLLAVENLAAVADGGRALMEMRYWDENGELVATVMQEGLFRKKPQQKL